MKSATIRIRIEEDEKTKIENFASRIDSTVSDILRKAADSAISGDVPGAKERMRCATLRRSANHLLDILAETPIPLKDLRVAVINIRTAASDLVQGR